MTDIKHEIHAACLELVEQKIITAQQLLDGAQESANSDTKSSAGDKYETGRAMAQLERDKAASQMEQALLMKKALFSLNTDKKYEEIQIGSVVKTNHGIFYISIALGEIKITDSKEKIFAISSAAPIGKLLMHKSAGDQLSFNSNNWEVLSVE